MKKEEVDIKQTEEKVLFPKTHSKELEFLKRKVQVSPLPISVATKIRAYFKEPQRKLGLSSLTLEETYSKKGDASYFENLKNLIDSKDDLDLELANAILNATFDLCQYYAINIATKEELDVQCPLSEAVKFIDTQLEVQGENDFLLRPLKAIMTLLREETPDLREIVKIQETPISSATFPSVKVGE